MANRARERNIQDRTERKRREASTASAGRERDMRIQVGQNSRRRKREPEKLELPNFSSKQKKETSFAEKQQSRREAPTQQTGTEEKRKKRLLFLRLLLVLIIVAVIGLLAYLLIRVETISVSGVQWGDPDSVIALSEIQQGHSILLLDKKQIKKRIESDPHFIFEKIQYHFPTGITIVVKERQEAACFAFANTYVIIDPDGLILGHVEKSAGTSLPEVTGLEVTEFVLGAEIRTTDTYKQDVLRDVLNALCAQNLQTVIQDIDMSNVNQIWMQLRDETKVCLGQGSQLQEKFQWLEQILLTIKENGHTGGTIDLTSVLAPVYVPEQTIDNSAEE